MYCFDVYMLRYAEVANKINEDHFKELEECKGGTKGLPIEGL